MYPGTKDDYDDEAERIAILEAEGILDVVMKLKPGKARLTYVQRCQELMQAKREGRITPQEFFKQCELLSKEAKD